MSTKENGHDVAIDVAFDDIVPYDPALPERNLLRAVLLNALSDLRKPGEPHREAAMFFLNTDEDYLFSFQSICNHLDIDPSRVLIVARRHMK
ncbi:MAG: hypothetical protein K1X79_09750 [Oligoflexia bacterium]|nr:hypothetical protein [Oligoflexia bacterium]